MERTVFSAGALTITLALAGAAGAVTLAPTFAGHQYASQARIGLSQARAIAMKARLGTITNQELEKERGGSGLRYSFDIRGAGKTYEVGVDAKTGKVLESGHESAAAEAAEH